MGHSLCGKELFYPATNKASFYKICEQEGVPYPKTLVITDYEAQLPFDFPIIIKPTDSMKYHSIDFFGKEKIYICKNQETYKKIIQNIIDNGYDDIILQEYIAGTLKFTLNLLNFMILPNNRKVV